VKARDNPFATDRIERLLEFEPRWAGASWDSIFDDWNALDRRAAIVGPHGSGKTTFLRAFESRLNTRGEAVTRYFLNDRCPTLTSDDWHHLESRPGDGGVIFLDGAERLGWSAWRRFAKLVAASSVLVTQHRQSRWPTLLQMQSSPALLAHLIDKAAGASFTADEVEHLYDRHGGNLREALWECYDRAGDTSAADLPSSQASAPITASATG
jgi:hypothetical protein